MIKLTDEQIRFYIENVNDDNGKTYAEILYEHILHFSPYGVSLSPEYDEGELKIFQYEDFEDTLVIKTIQCDFLAFKLLTTASEEDFKNIVDELTIDKKVIDKSPRKLVVGEEWINHLENLSPYEQRQYNEFIQNSH